MFGEDPGLTYPVKARLPTVKRDRRVWKMSVRFLRSGVAVVACLIGLIPAAAVANGTNSRVTRDSQAGSYTRYHGGTEATITHCRSNKRAPKQPNHAGEPDH